MDEPTTPVERGTPLSAREFFATRIKGRRLTDAQIGTGLAYSTLHDIARGETEAPRIETLLRLERWSRAKVMPTHGVYISAAHTLADLLARARSEAA